MKKQTRKSVKTIANVSLQMAEKSAAIFTAKSTRLAALEAELNQQLQRIKDQYTDEVNEITQICKEQFAVLQVFATEQKTSWGKRKSLELLHAVVGFRTGTPAVQKPKGFTWDAILLLVKPLFPNLVRSKEEVNKELILQLNEDKDEETLKALEEKCFVTIGQEESFYVTPKVEELTTAVQ